MKKIIIVSPVLLAIGALIWVSAAGGVAKVQKKDRTGSPVSDVNCTQCHMIEADFSTNASIQILSISGQVVTEYIPETEYIVKTEITSQGNSGHGFQITGMLNDHSSAGSIIPETENTQMSSLNNRWYFESSKAVTGGVYVTKWISPKAGSGEVTFYGSAISTNGNGKTTGDEYMNIPNTVLSEGGVTGLAEMVNDVNIYIYPNPVSSILRVESSQLVDRLQVYDLTGKIMIDKPVNGMSLNMRVEGLKNGNYMLVIKSAGTELKRSVFVKQ